MIYRTLHRKLNIEQREPYKHPGVTSLAPEELAILAQLAEYVVLTLVTNPVISHESEKGVIVIATNGTYP